MKVDGHSGVGRYPALVPAFAGMTTWPSGPPPEFHAAFSCFVAPQQVMTVRFLHAYW